MIIPVLRSDVYCFLAVFIDTSEDLESLVTFTSGQLFTQVQFSSCS